MGVQLLRQHTDTATARQAILRYLALPERNTLETKPVAEKDMLLDISTRYPAFNYTNADVLVARNRTTKERRFVDRNTALTSQDVLISPFFCQKKSLDTALAELKAEGLVSELALGSGEWNTRVRLTEPGWTAVAALPALTREHYDHVFREKQDIKESSSALPPNPRLTFSEFEISTALGRLGAKGELPKTAEALTNALMEELRNSDPALFPRAATG